MKFNKDTLPWNENDKIIKKMPSDYNYDDFEIHYGDCNYRNETTIFRFLIINQKTKNYYRHSFNSKWCPEDDKEWLMDIMVRNIMSAISEVSFDCRMNLTNSINGVLRQLDTQIRI